VRAELRATVDAIRRAAAEFDRSEQGLSLTRSTP